MAGLQEMHKTNVLIIDSNSSRAGELKSILDLLDVTPVLTCPQRWQDQVEDSSTVLAAILGYDNECEATRLIWDVYRWNPSIPICLLDYIFNGGRFVRAGLLQHP